MPHLCLRAMPLLAALAGAAAGQDPTAVDPAAPIRLRYAVFDPQLGEPAVPAALRSDEREALWIAQFAGVPTDQGRGALRETGAEVHRYLPDNAYVVRADVEIAGRLRAVGGVRWVGAYHPAYRLEPELVAAIAAGKAPPPQRYNIVVVDKLRDKPALGRALQALGGVALDEQEGSLLFTVTLTAAQLVQAARLPQVLWIDRWTPDENDMDNARIQGGANVIEAAAGYTGAGVNVHIYEGIEATHADFTGGATNIRSGGGADTHGHCTAGIVFGNGSSNPIARGMAPDCTKFFTQYSSVIGSRYQVVQDLVTLFDISHTTASWGGALTLYYTSVSAEADDIVFDHGIAWTQSQSNAGTQMSRPQAWGKNVISIGGVRHNDNSNPADDSWLAGNGSTGPAADGRIKPILCAYYDNIATSDRTGADGYNTTGDFTLTFGGTSGATPIVAGHDVLAIQMFTDGIFGNQLRNPGGSRFSNRPHFTTLQSLQIVSARQYPFTAASTDNRREHQGWGFPDLAKMWNYRAKTLVVDETSVLAQGTADRWLVTVAPGETELKISMSFADPPANPAAATTLINDMSLRVQAPDGTRYWGNHGLELGNYSQIGGTEDHVNTIENVFVQNPLAGVWTVDVIATRVVMDGHVETPAVDADYGLVVSGGTGVAGPAPTPGTFDEYGAACPGSLAVSPTCAELNPTGGTLVGSSNTNEYAYTVPNIGSLQVVGFDIFSVSRTGAAVVVPARLYADNGSGAPATTPIASTTMTVGTAAGFYTATFAAPVAVTGTFYLGFDTSAATATISQLTSGANGSAYFRGTPLSGTWSASGVVTRPAYRVTCASGGFLSPSIGYSAPPEIGSTYALTLADALPITLAIGTIGFSDATYAGVPLPAVSPLAPGCALLAAPDLTLVLVTGGTGATAVGINVPADVNLVGLDLYHQWIVADPVNALGFITSAALHGRIGRF